VDNHQEVATHHNLSVSVSRRCVKASGVTDGPTGGQCQRVPEINKWKTKKESEDKIRTKVIKKERDTEGRIKKRKRKETKISMFAH